MKTYGKVNSNLSVKADKCRGDSSQLYGRAWLCGKRSTSCITMQSILFSNFDITSKPALINLPLLKKSSPTCSTTRIRKSKFWDFIREIMLVRNVFKCSALSRKGTKSAILCLEIQCFGRHLPPGSKSNDVCFRSSSETAKSSTDSALSSLSFVSGHGLSSGIWVWNRKISKYLGFYPRRGLKLTFINRPRNLYIEVENCRIPESKTAPKGRWKQLYLHCFRRSFPCRFRLRFVYF